MELISLGKLLNGSKHIPHWTLFFDFYDLPPGELFENHIKKNIEKDHNLFLAIKTDNYTTRMWCISEVLNARKIEIPILVIDAVMIEEKRSFPYLTNCKTIRADIKFSNDDDNSIQINNIDYIISEAVLELLKAKVNTLRQKFIVKNINIRNIKLLNNQPDLFNLLYSLKDSSYDNSIKTNFVYPDPPISNKEETEIKTLISKDVSLTPNSITALYNSCNSININALDIQNIELGYSVATPNDISKYGYLDRHLYSYLIELGRYFIYHKIKFSYGGDINYSDEISYMKAFAIMTDYYREDMSYKITNYLTERTKNRISLNERIKYEAYVNFIEPKYLMDETYKENDNIYISKARSNMRIQMNEKITSRIVIGGRITTTKAFCGILEEFLLAMESRKPIYLIGVFGGMSKIIGDIIFGKVHPDELDYKSFSTDNQLVAEYERLENKKFDYYSIFKSLFNQTTLLNNGLNLEDNLELFSCKNPRRAFQLIAKGISHHTKSDIS